MKVWEIQYPDEKYGDITECLTDDGIISQYYDYWSTAMVKVGKTPLITRDNCIQDFVIVHWAKEVKYE